jgi:flavin-dependent dehydrogenase
VNSQMDVAIVGGGIAGTATAIALRKLGLSVTVIERGNYERQQIGETVPPEIRLPLTQLGVWEEFLALGNARSVALLSAWGSSRLDVVDHIFNPYGNGWTVARPALERMLAAAAVRHGATLLCGADLRECARRADGLWQFELAHDGALRVIRSGFAIAATGRAGSALHANGKTKFLYDRLIGIICLLARPSTWPADDTRPLIEAVRNGWWYSVLLPDTRVMVAFMTDSDLAKREIRSLGSRHALLQVSLASAPHTFERLDRRLDSVTESRVVSANTYCNGEFAQASSLAVGDAAFAIDPLAGQGITSALDGACVAAETVAAYRWDGEAALKHSAGQERLLFEHLLLERTAYYRLEQRWADAPFWQRRHRRATASLAASLGSTPPHHPCLLERGMALNMSK